MIEREIADAIKISRSPVREAIKNASTTRIIRLST